MVLLRLHECAVGTVLECTCCGGRYLETRDDHEAQPMCRVCRDRDTDPDVSRWDDDGGQAVAS